MRQDKEIEERQEQEVCFRQVHLSVFIEFSILNTCQLQKHNLTINTNHVNFLLNETDDINYSNITSISSRANGFLGWLFSFGRIEIQTENDLFVLNYMKSYKKLRDEIKKRRNEEKG